MKRNVLILCVVLFLVTGLAVVFAGGKQEAPKPAKTEAAKTETKTEDIKLGYVCKMLTHPWFIQEDWGCREKCKELGVEYASVDSNLDDEQTLAAVDNLIAQEFDGIAVVTPNIGLGCAIDRMCKEAGVAWILIDSATENDCDGNVIPMVEMPSFDGGVMGGEALAKLAKKKGFFDKGNIVKVLAIDIPTINVVHDRALGYKKGLFDNCPSLEDKNFIFADSVNGMFEDDLQVSSAVFNAHPDATHWIIAGLNDDCGIAPLQVLRENGFNMDNAIACGLGGNELSLDQFNNGNENYICVYMPSDGEGAEAMQQLYDNITKGAPLHHQYVPGKIVSVDNYLEFFPGGKLKF
jgi:L-arabinose transport system substrate-binding protein